MQRDLLPLIEGTTVSTKYGPVKTDHILFIASGAFHVSKPSDLLPELQGRLPIRVELQALSKDDLVGILKDTDASLIKQYVALMATEGLTLDFQPDGIDAIADAAVKVNSTVENIGARRLQTIMERLVEDISFEAPEKKGEVDQDRPRLCERPHRQDGGGRGSEPLRAVRLERMSLVRSGGGESCRPFYLQSLGPNDLRCIGVERGQPLRNRPDPARIEFRPSRRSINGTNGGT